MKKWNLIIDVAKCHDCNNCFLACKDEYFENDFLPFSVAQPKHGQRWVNIMRRERGEYPKVEVAYLPVMCMHCDDPPCAAKIGNDVIYERDDGIVLIDPQKAKGRRDIVDACPYDAIWWNEEKEVAQKCTLCAHLLENGWEQPRCVQSCPTGAMSIVQVTDEERQHLIEKEKLEAYQPQHKSHPRVVYKNLYKYLDCFIAGSVALSDSDECAEGAKIRLKKDSETVLDEVLTNNYGDFKFDRLKENSGFYDLEIEYNGIKKKATDIELKTSVNIGTVFL